MECEAKSSLMEEKKKRSKKRKHVASNSLDHIDASLKECVDTALENSEMGTKKRKNKKEKPNNSEFSNINVEEDSVKSDMDAEIMQNNEALGVEKKKKKKKKKDDVSISLVQDDNWLKKDTEAALDIPAVDTKQRIKKREKQKLELINLHNDYEEHSGLVENLPLKSDAGVESVQNNSTFGDEKKKNKKKQKKEDDMPFSLVQLDDCLKKDIKHDDHEEDSMLVGTFSLKSDADIDSVKIIAAYEIEKKKKRKKQKKGDNNHDDCEEKDNNHEYSVLVEKHPLKSDADGESVQNNTTFGTEKKKKRREKQKNENDMSISLVQVDDCSMKDIKHDDRVEDSVFLMNSSLKTDVDLENVQYNATLRGEKKKKRDKQKMKDDVSIPLVQADDCTEKDVGTASKSLLLDTKQKKNTKNIKEKHNNKEFINLQNDLKEEVLMVNPLTKIDVDLDSVQVKKKKKNKIDGSVPSVHVDEVEKVTSSELTNLHNNIEKHSELVMIPPMKSDINEKSGQNNDATLGSEKKKKSEKQKIKDDMSILSVQVEDCVKENVEIALDSPTLDTERRKKRKNKKEMLSSSEFSNIHNEREEVSVSLENPQKRSDLDFESLHSKSSLVVEKKSTGKRELKRNALEDVTHNDLENSAIHTEVENGSLLVENPPPLEDDSSIVGPNLENEKIKEQKLKKRKALDNNNTDLKLVNNLDINNEILSSVSNSVNLDSKTIKEDEESPINGSSVTCSLIEDDNTPDENVKTCQKRVQEQHQTCRKKPKLSGSLGCLELVNEIETTQVPDSSLGQSSKMQIMEESPVKKISITCVDAPSESLKNIKDKDNLQSIFIDKDKLESTSRANDNLESISHDKDNFESTSCDKNNLESNCCDKVNLETISYDKDDLINDLSKCDSTWKLLEQKNDPKENINKNKSSSSKLDPVENDIDPVLNNKDTIPPEILYAPEKALAINSRKKLLILDVNGLLADIVTYASYSRKPDTIISGKKVFKRPFCVNFLYYCFARFDVAVWSSRNKRNVDSVINFLLGNSRDRLLFCWDQSHCTHTGFNTLENNEKPLVLKELKKVWEKHEAELPFEKGVYNESNTLLLDDSPYKAVRNPAHTAIFPHPYRYDDAKDCSLGPGGDLRVYLDGLAKCENVQDYVKQNPFGQTPITESDLSWDFYSKIISADSNGITEAQSSVVTAAQQ